MPQLKLSIVIPTRNRAAMLYDTLQSVLAAYEELYKNVECLLIDNGSSDDTAHVVANFAHSAPFTVRYVFEACPGLHVGRNLGAQLASGEILAYLDDDVIVAPGWFTAVMQNFTSQPDLALLGGPCVPRWESPPPSWVEKFRVPCGENGWMISPLSLVMYSDSQCAIPGQFVFGCNYCVRKDVVLSTGGFHPDGMPPQLLKFRGDGETGMACWIEAHGLSIRHDPNVRVEHRVPGNRMTARYFLGIYKRNGISAAYALTRDCEGTSLGIVKNIAKHFISVGMTMLGVVKSAIRKRSALPDIFLSYAHMVCITHSFKVLFSKKLRGWVVQKSYFLQDPCPYWKK